MTLTYFEQYYVLLIWDECLSYNIIIHEWNEIKKDNHYLIKVFFNSGVVIDCEFFNERLTDIFLFVWFTYLYIKISIFI